MKKISIFFLILATSVFAKTLASSFLTYTTASASAYSTLPAYQCNLVKVQNTTANDINFMHVSEVGGATTNVFVLKSGATFTFTVSQNSNELRAYAAAQVSPSIEAVSESP